MLNELNISAELIDLRSVKPLDINTIIESVKKTNKILCVEDGWGFSGIGSEIIAQINEFAFDYLDHQPERVCQEEIPMPYARNLETLVNISKEKIVNKVKTMLMK
jgi:pyruvate dehydrogenase E1 component beta subunit